MQQAALWTPTDAQTDEPDQYHLQHEQQPQAMDTRTDADSKQQTAGYVSVSGIDLACRNVDTAATETTGHAPKLVHTPAMVDNIKAAALALCQNRPLLLEGPPGESCRLHTLLAVALFRASLSLLEHAGGLGN